MDDAAKTAEQVQHLIGLVMNTRSLYFQLATALAEDGPSEVIYAARAVHEGVRALAKTEIDAETLAAAHRTGRREKVTADLKKTWDAAYSAGIAEGIRRSHVREVARSIPFRALRVVRTLSR